MSRPKVFVARRIPDIEETYKQDKAKYFVGVARNIIREARRNREIATDAIPEKPVSEPKIGDELDCLRRCLKFLSAEMSFSSAFARLSAESIAIASRSLA